MRKALCSLAAGGGALARAGRTRLRAGAAAGESATDRPDIVTGAQVHAVVVTPADSADQFATDANKLADDVASMSAWWTAQDPTRVPRYRRGDLSERRRASTSRSCACRSRRRPIQAPPPPSARSGCAGRSRLALPYKDYLVYYDGPSVEDDICGIGGGGFDQGGAYAVVWLNGCPDVPTDNIGDARAAARARGRGARGARTTARRRTTDHPCDSRPTSSTRTRPPE